jgi:RNA polymerase sigma-70 factor (ECF subfamily)
MDAVYRNGLAVASAHAAASRVVVSGPVSIDSADAARSASGDTAAFERLYRRHEARVHRLARRIVGEEHAEDATQDIFFRAWTKMATYRADAAFSTWLHRLAVNVLIRWDRGPHGARHAALGPSDDTIPATTPAPDAFLDLDAALAALPADLRTVVVLHDIEGFSHEEIGELLNISLTAARMRLYRARLALRAFAAGR